MKYLIISLLLIATGCAFNKEDTSNELKKQNEKNVQVQEQFKSITGTYTGTVKFSNITHEVRLIIKIVSEPNGTDSNGTPLFKDVAKGIYKKINPVGDDQTLLAAYDNRSGVLSLSKPTDNGPNSGNSSSSAPDDVSYIQATMTGQRIAGTMNTVSGSSAPIDLTLSTRETGNGSPEDENFERLKSEVSQIVGIYKGTLPDPKAQGGLQRIKISLSMMEVGKVISLNALYQREDIPSGVVDLNLSATYRTDVTPRVITFSGRGGGTYFLDIAGPIARNPTTNLFEIAAVVNLRGSFLGRTLLKQQPAPDVTTPKPRNK